MAALAVSVASPAPALHVRYPSSESAIESEPSFYDVLGLAQSMCDVTTEGCVSDALLASLQLPKGGRRYSACGPNAMHDVILKRNAAAGFWRRWMSAAP